MPVFTRLRLQCMFIHAHGQPEHTMDMTTSRATTLGKIPSGVWVLGFVSLLMDISSEMIHSLLPLFMVGTLGASALLVGMIEGLAEATALIVKVFSGVLSDYLALPFVRDHGRKEATWRLEELERGA